MSPHTFYLILSNIPFWVWPLLALLILVGLRSASARSVNATFFWFLPLIGLATIPTLIRIGRIETVPMFFVAYAIGALAGRRYQRGIVTGFTNNQVHLRGEWVTMITVMVMFLANFAFGIISARSPELSQSLMFLMPFVFLIGACSGSFFGRSVHVVASSRIQSLSNQESLS